MECDNWLDDPELNQLSFNAIGSCISVHKELGPGLLESVYLDLLCYDLSLKGIPYEREFMIQIPYKGQIFNTKLRADLVVDNRLIIELKAVQSILPVHEAQIMTYMKLTNIEIGLLINFNVTKLVDGVSRFRLNYGKLAKNA